jgi:hypothetical protein
MPDIFISYAHRDNQPVSGEEKGWISHFVNNLFNEFSRKVGRAESYQTWMDYCLKGSDEVTPEIEKQLKETYVLVILLSSAWLASEWCQRELAIFIEKVKQVAGRVFVVELDRIEVKDKPLFIRDLVTYRFWRETDERKVRQLGYPVPQTSDSSYYDRLADLSSELATVIRNKNSAIEKSPVMATVYVAPVIDALYEHRERLISELRQFSIDVLPRSNDLDGNMEEALARCSHFVQLLDADWTMGIPFRQHEAALSSGKPIIQWRDAQLVYAVDKLREEHVALLNGKTVIASPLSDFIRHVRETVLPKPKSDDEDMPKRRADEPMVFVHACQDDFNHAHSIAQRLKAKGYGYVLPRYNGDAERIRKSITRGYELCDIMLMVQQCGAAEVVEDFLSEARVHILKREKKPPILFCQCSEAEELLFIPPGMAILVCDNQFEENCVDQFLTEMNA